MTLMKLKYWLLLDWRVAIPCSVSVFYAEVTWICSSFFTVFLVDIFYTCKVCLVPESLCSSVYYWWQNTKYFNVLRKWLKIQNGVVIFITFSLSIAPFTLKEQVVFKIGIKLFDTNTSGIVKEYVFVTVLVCRRRISNVFSCLCPSVHKGRGFCIPCCTGNLSYDTLGWGQPGRSPTPHPILLQLFAQWRTSQEGERPPISSDGSGERRFVWSD